jgi:hypothetical protein
MISTDMHITHVLSMDDLMLLGEGTAGEAKAYDKVLKLFYFATKLVKSKEVNNQLSSCLTS